MPWDPWETLGLVFFWRGLTEDLWCPLARYHAPHCCSYLLLAHLSYGILGSVAFLFVHSFPTLPPFLPLSLPSFKLDWEE